MTSKRHLNRFLVTLLGFIAFTSTHIYAETIDGPANIRLTPNGKTIASMYDRSPIEVEGKDGDWYLVRVLFFVENNMIKSNESIIGENTEFSDTNGTKIGKTLDTIKVDYGPNGDSNRSQLTFVGYTHRQNIVPESLVEESISKIVKSGANLNVNTDVWKKHLALIDYQPWTSIDSFETFLLYENDYYDISPEPRIILFFYSDKLVGILHKSPLDLGNNTKKEVISGYTISFIPGTSKDLIKKIREIYFPIIRGAD
jgi:hypothetical protein